MSGDFRLGEFEELVLLAIPRLEGAYAVSIQRCIEKRTGRVATMGAVYTALDRLEEKGYTKSRLGESTPRQGGRRKRYYKITDGGIVALNKARLARERMWQGLELKPSWQLT